MRIYPVRMYASICSKRSFTLSFERDLWLWLALTWHTATHRNWYTLYAHYNAMRPIRNIYFHFFSCDRTRAMDFLFYVWHRMAFIRVVQSIANSTLNVYAFVRWRFTMIHARCRAKGALSNAYCRSTCIFSNDVDVDKCRRLCETDIYC